MSRPSLEQVCEEFFERTENALTPASGLPRAVDEYFVERIKQDEITYASIEPGYYEGLRELVKSKVLPVYEEYLMIRAGILGRKHGRKLWAYVLGTVVALGVLEAVLSRARSLVPTLMVFTTFINALLGFAIYSLAQYKDEVLLRRARQQLQHSLAGLDKQLTTDITYDTHRRLMDDEVLKAEAMEIIAEYTNPAEFWRDYLKARQADPVSPQDMRRLQLPAFEKFLKYHADGSCSEVAREHRFNRLFVEAHELFIGKDRARYVMQHLRDFN
jgi:hypothetical protein